MINWIKEKMPKPEPEPEPQPVGEVSEEVMQLYNELDNEYNLSSIVDKEEVIKKIIEVKCDREEMNNWIFDKL